MPPFEDLCCLSCFWQTGRSVDWFSTISECKWLGPPIHAHLHKYRKTVTKRVVCEVSFDYISVLGSSRWVIDHDGRSFMIPLVVIGMAGGGWVGRFLKICPQIKNKKGDTHDRDHNEDWSHVCFQVNEAFTVVYSGGRDKQVWATDIRNPESRNLICEEAAPILRVRPSLKQLSFSLSVSFSLYLYLSFCLSVSLPVTCSLSLFLSRNLSLALTLSIYLYFSVSFSLDHSLFLPVFLFCCAFCLSHSLYLSLSISLYLYALSLFLLLHVVQSWTQRIAIYYDLLTLNGHLRSW